MHGLFLYFLTYLIDKLRFKIYFLKGEKSLSAEMEIIFTELMLTEKIKWAMKKHEEIPSSSDRLFEKNPKVFEPQFFLLELPEGSCQESKITGTPAETVDVSSAVHRSLRDQFVSLIATEERVQSWANHQRWFVLIDHNKEV